MYYDYYILHFHCGQPLNCCCVCAGGLRNWRQAPLKLQKAGCGVMSPPTLQQHSRMMQGHAAEVLETSLPVFKLQYTEWRLSAAFHPPPQPPGWRV